MSITKQDALRWFKFFAELPEDESLMTSQYEIVYEVLAKIEKTVNRRADKLRSEIKNLKSLDGRTYYVGNSDLFPKGCVSCLTGTGLTAIRKTNKCNVKCPFCYNFGELEECMPIGEGMWEIGESKYYENDIDMLLKIQQKPSGVAYVYLEPFMEIEKYYSVIKKFHDAGVYQHLYTNGTLCTEENLKALGEAGLDELRFNLGASNTSDKVIKAMKTAKKYMPMVGIETPMTPQFYDAFFKKKEKILSTGIDFMNCAELHLGPNNIVNYLGENMYMCHQGYLSPIWSHELTLKLMKTADDEKWPINVHDCDNMTKIARGLNQAAKEGKWFGAGNYGSEFDEVPFEAFIPVLSDDQFEFED